MTTTPTTTTTATDDDDDDDDDDDVCHGRRRRRRRRPRTTSTTTTPSVQDINVPHPTPQASQRNQNQNKHLSRDNGWPRRERGRNIGNARGSRRPAQDHVADSMPPPTRPPQALQQNHNNPVYASDYPPSEHVSPITHPSRDDILVPAAHISRHEDTSPSAPPLTDDMQPHPFASVTCSLALHPCRYGHL